MNLFLAELRRFTSRRIFRIPLLVIFGLIAIGVIISIVNAAVNDPDPRSVSSPTKNVFVPFNFWLTLLAVLVGSSSLGAEFSTASLSTQLLFEPRRVRVFLTKAGAVATGCAAMNLIILTIVAAINFSGINERGGTSWPEVASDMGRIIAIASLTAVLAFSITAFTKKSAGAMFSIVGLLLVETLFLAKFDWLVPRLPIMRTITIMAYDPSAGDDEIFKGLVHTDLTAAFAVVSVWTAVVLAGSCWYFSRSEIR